MTHCSRLETRRQVGAIFSMRTYPLCPRVFRAAALRDMSHTFAFEAARRWLLAQGVRSDAMTPDTAARLVMMATDAASPAKVDFPTGVTVRRRGGEIFVDGHTPA